MANLKSQVKNFAVRGGGGAAGLAISAAAGKAYRDRLNDPVADYDSVRNGDKPNWKAAFNQALPPALIGLASFWVGGKQRGDVGKALDSAGTSAFAYSAYNLAVKPFVTGDGLFPGALSAGRGPRAQAYRPQALNPGTAGHYGSSGRYGGLRRGATTTRPGNYVAGPPTPYGGSPAAGFGNGIAIRGGSRY